MKNIKPHQIIHSNPCQQFPSQSTHKKTNSRIINYTYKANEAKSNKSQGNSKVSSKSFLVQAENQNELPAYNVNVVGRPSHQNEPQKFLYLPQQQQLHKDKLDHQQMSRNSMKSLFGTQNNRFNSMSSKALLSTMNSNQMFSTESNSQRKYIENFQHRPMPDINRIYFTSQESAQSKSRETITKSMISSEHVIRVEEFSLAKFTPHERKQMQLQQSINIQEDFVSNQKRESDYTTFDEDDFNERGSVMEDENQQIPSVQLAHKIKKSLEVRALQPFKQRDTNQMNQQNYNVAKLSQKNFIKFQQNDSLQKSPIKKSIICQCQDDHTDSVNNASKEIDLTIPKTTSSPIKHEEQQLFLSQIQHKYEEHNDSKPSETDIKLWMHLTEENNRESNNSFKQQYQEDSYSQMLRNNSRCKDYQNDPMDLSLPVEINDENEYQSSYASENQSQTQTQSSQGIKQYLGSLKKLKDRYQQICQDLINEENINIQSTTLQIIQSEEFRRLSLNSRSQMLAQKIIEIRDEYRNVIQLLKNQHNFQFEFEDINHN